ncbi:MAG: hypothetical protein H0U70_12165 [Tatlockia sp.]|nr:hypothetical protein [Tatlockia sp.]
MVSSKVDDVRLLTKNEYCISIMKCLRNNPRKGFWGVVLIEGLDEDGEAFLFQIGHSFYRSRGYEVSRIELETCKTYLSSSTSLSSYSVSREQVDQSELGVLLATENIPYQEVNFNADYSYKKANELLIKSKVIQPVVTFEWWNIDSEPFLHSIRWNPFARLLESKKFPTARIIRSSLWNRIKDIFFILNGSLYAENQLGITDYLFPWPRILTAALISDINLIIKFAIFIPAISLLAVRTLASLLITIPISLFVAFAHAIFNRTTQDIDALKIKPINGEFEDIGDIDSFDLLEETTLSSYGLLNDALTIKPIEKNGDLYVEIPESYPLNAKAPLALGLFQNGVPRGVLEISSDNHKGIFSLLERNEGGVTKALEESEAIEQILLLVRP